MAFSGVSRACDLGAIAVWAGAGQGDPAPPEVNGGAAARAPRDLKEHIAQDALEDTDQRLALGCVQSPACG